jgi:hypothetical protein
MQQQDSASPEPLQTHGGTYIRTQKVCFELLLAFHRISRRDYGFHRLASRVSSNGRHVPFF